MGKLKKVLLLVLALCVMISIMSIAAAAGDTDYPVANVTESTNDKDMDVVGFDSILGGSNVYGTVKPLPKWTFTAVDTSAEASSGPYSNWGCDYLVSMDEATDAYSIGLYGCYGGWENGLLVSFLNPVSVEAGQKLPLLGSMAKIPWTYQMIVDNVGTFHCGAYNLSPENVGKTLTVQLVIWDQDNGSIDDPVVVQEIEYTFTDYIPLVNKDTDTRYFYKSSGYDANSYTLDGNGYLTELEGEGPHFAPAVAQIDDNYYASLADAIAAAQSGDTITLLADVESSSSTSLNKSITLDLNGHTITSSAVLFNIYSNCNLTIKDSGEDGAINVTADKIIYSSGGGLVRIEGGALTVSGTSTYTYGVLVGSGSSFEMTGGSITIPATSTSTYNYCVSGSGSGSITISGGELTAQGSGGNYTVAGSGSCNINITGGYISGYAYPSGFKSPYVIYNTGSGIANISGGYFRAIGDSATYSAGYLIEGKASVSGGYFGGVYFYSLSADKFATGYRACINTDPATKANYKFAVTTPVAQIGNNYYATLADAIAAAQDGNTIKLLNDVSVSETVEITKSIILDGCDHTLTTTATRGIWIDSSNVNVTIENMEIVSSNNQMERSIQVNPDCDGVTLNLNKITTTATYYTINICSNVDNLVLNIENSNLTGWGVINLWGNNGTVNVSNSTLVGVNDKGYNAEGWNDFGVLVIEGDTTGQTTEHAYAYNVTVVDTTIESQSTTGNHQFTILYNNPSVGNAITLEDCSITLGNANCSFFNDQGESSETKVKKTYLTETTDRPELPEEYLYAPCGEDYYLITKAVAQIGTTKYTSLEEAFAAAQDGDTITLLTNVTLTERLFINAGSTPAYAGSDNRYATTTENKSITLDLNGKNITSSSNIALAGGSLNITGTGTIATTASGLAPVEIRGTGELTSKRTLTIGEDVVLTGAQYGLNVFGSNDSNKNVIDVTVNGRVNGTLFVLGNLTNTQNEINIVVNGKVLAPANTDDAIVGIALNGNANVTVNTGAEISGESGIEVRRGTLVVNDGTITATATEYSSTANNSGSTTKGAAIAIYQYGTGLDVTIKGGDLSGVKTIAVNGDMSGVSASALQTYTTDNTVIPEGYKWAAAGENMYTLTVITYVAQIGDVKYETLQAAIAAAQDGDTIVLLTNVTQDAGILFDKADVSVKLDLNAKTLTVNDGSNINNRAIKINNGTLEVYNGSIVAVGSGTTSSDGVGCYGAFRVEANGKLIAHDLTLTNSRPWGLNVKVLGGEAELTNVTINSSYGGGIEVTETTLGGHSKAGKATLTNCTFTQENYFDHCSTALSVSGGSELIVNSGSYTGEYALYVFSSGGKIKVNGGTFTGLGNRPAIVAAIDLNTYSGYEGGFEISGGSFSGSYNITSPAYMTITGGYFTVDPTTYVADGYAVETGTYEIGNATYNYKVGVAPVAQIGETKYTSLEAAIAAAQDGDTITLLENITITGTTVEDRLIVNKTITLDMNAKTIGFGVSNSGNNFAVLWVLDGATLTITGNGTINGIYGQAYGINVGYVQKSDRDESKGNLVIESGTFKGDTSAIQIQYGTVTINGGYFEANPYQNSYRYTLNCIDEYYAANKAVYKVKGGSYFEFDPANSDSENPKGNFVVEGYKSVSNTVNEHIVYTVSEQYVEQSTTNTTTTTTTTDELGTTTTTTTTTNLAADTNGQDTQYVIKVETTTVTTSTDDPENTTEDTNTVYKPVTVDVTSNNNVDNPQVTTTDVSASNADKIESAKTAIETDVTNAANAQSATFEAKLDENDEASSANVLKTTAAANAIAKAAATVSANQTENITDAKIELKTTLKSYTLADGTNSSVKATKVVYDIKPVAVIYKVENEVKTQLGDAVELDNADIKEGETFTFTIPVPANMTASTVKVSHIGTNGYSTEIGTYTVEGTGNNRYVTVTVDHFSEFELEETTVAIDGNCKITAAIALDDSININFYVQNLASGTSKENYKVVYSFNGETETTVNGASWVETATGSGKYFFKVAECAASQMNDKVSFKVYYNDGYNDVEIKSISYSIRDYCVNMIKKNSDQKLVELCRAVLDYGAAAQNYFNYNTANLANADGYGLASPVTEIPSEFNALAVDRRSDVSKLTVSLNTVSKTEINFYITASDVTDVTVKLGTTPVEGVVTEQLSDGRYKVTIKGIAAAYLNNAYTLTFKTTAGTSTLRYSALTYSYGKQSSQTAGELSLAIYNYYLKAAAYFS